MDLKKFKVFQSLDPVFIADVKYACFIGIDTAGPPRGGILVMKNDDVYSVARSSDDLKLLGIPKLDEVLPQQAAKIKTLCGKGITEICSGQNHVVALRKDGHIYRWGDGDGLPTVPEILLGTLEDKKVVQIACGQWHSMCLTSDGQVYSWGENSNGELGLRQVYSNQLDPVIVSGDNNGFDLKIKAIDCGAHNSYAVDVDGNVWSWGSNGAALGFNSTAVQRTPRKLTGIKMIKRVVAGNSHVLALSYDNDLIFWGAHGEQNGSVPTVISSDLGKVVDMATTRGCKFSVLKTISTVYFWGEWYQMNVSVPRATSFSTIEEVFAAADPPVLCRTVECNGRGQRISDTMKAAFDDQETADVKFSVERKVLHAHKTILRFRSEHFHRMFEHKWKENIDDAAIEIEKFNYQGFRAFIYYLYTDRIESLPVGDMQELIRIADYYGEEDVHQRCQELLKVFVNTKNVCELYAFAIQFNAKNLEEYCRDFVIPNFTEVVEQDGFAVLADVYKTRLILQLATKGVFEGLKPKM